MKKLDFENRCEEWIYFEICPGTRPKIKKKLANWADLLRVEFSVRPQCLALMGL